MNQYCLEFMRTVEQGEVVDEKVKLKFIASLIDCLNAGYYLACGSKTGWKLSNKYPEKREQQQRDMATMVNTLFTKQ